MGHHLDRLTRSSRATGEGGRGEEGERRGRGEGGEVGGRGEGGEV